MKNFANGDRVVMWVASNLSLDPKSGDIRAMSTRMLVGTIVARRLHVMRDHREPTVARYDVRFDGEANLTIVEDSGLEYLDDRHAGVILAR